jgi:UDP-N-acetylglucosamine transferase subunit ALG13
MYDVKPKFYNVGLIPLDEFNKYMNDAEVVITHSGVNSIISCMQLNKPLVIVPRRGEYGEHVDDHQIEIAELMEEKFNVLVCHNMDELENLIQKAKNLKYKPWISHKEGLISALKNIIE